MIVSLLRFVRRYVVVVNDNGVPQNFMCHIEGPKIRLGAHKFDGIMDALK